MEAPEFRRALKPVQSDLPDFRKPAVSASLPEFRNVLHASYGRLCQTSRISDVTATFRSSSKLLKLLSKFELASKCLVTAHLFCKTHEPMQYSALSSSLAFVSGRCQPWRRSQPRETLEASSTFQSDPRGSRALPLETLESFPYLELGLEALDSLETFESFSRSRVLPLDCSSPHSKRSSLPFSTSATLHSLHPFRCFV